MTWYPISEETFRKDLYAWLDLLKFDNFKAVTGPGRSGAIISVYISHYLNIPFIPHKSAKGILQPLLIVDTVSYTGNTLAKSKAWHQKRGIECSTWYLYQEEKNHYYKFWYEK